MMMPPPAKAKKIDASLLPPPAGKPKADASMLPPPAAEKKPKADASMLLPPPAAAKNPKADASMLPPPAAAKPTQPKKSSPAPKGPPPPVNYTAPEWSAEAAHPFTFEVIKNGAVVEAIDVTNKPFVLIGRQDDVCDIAMQHPSISRQHAVIQHRDTGQVYVYELGSTHGTFVNKTRLKSKQHVELSVGDVLRFGASTRLYCLQGPDDLRKEVLRDKHTPAELQKLKYDLLQQRKKQNQERQEQAAAAAAEQLASATCMWGEQEDAQEDEEFGSARKAAADASGGLSSFGSAQRVQSTWEIEKEMKETETKKAGMSDRELKLMEKIEAKTAKLNNMQMECERISAKEAEGDLSEGQRNQLTQNETRAAKVREDVETLEEEMDELKRTQARQRGEYVPPSRKGGRRAGDDDSDDDEFFDRASEKKKKKARAGKGKGGEKGSKGAQKKASLPELRKRKAELEKQQAALKKELMIATVEEQSGEDGSSATLDPLDAFMKDNKQAGKAQRKVDAVAKLQVLATEMAEIDQTLSFAQPAYLSLKTADVDATKLEAAKPKPVSAAAAALGSDLVSTAREYTDKTEEYPKGQPVEKKREVSAPRAPAVGSMAAAIAQAKSSKLPDEGPPPAAEGSSARGPTFARPGRGSAAAEDAAAAAAATEEERIPDRISTADLIARLAKERGEKTGTTEGQAAHTGAGGLGSEPTGGGAAKSKPAPASAKRARMIDGKSGGLQVMSKKQKKEVPQYGRGSRQVRDDEDELNGMSDGGYGGGGSGSGGAASAGGGMAMQVARETAAEKRVREEAEYAWAPPTQSSQKKQASLAASLGY